MLVLARIHIEIIHVLATYEISDEPKTVCEKKLNDGNKIHKFFRRCFEIDLLLFSFAYFITLNSAFEYRLLWQFVIFC